MDLTEYRSREIERERIANLMGLLHPGRSVLDVGARDGHVSRELLGRFEFVTALDLEKPAILDERITCVQGDVTNLQFPPDTFDVVLCAEVLEHIPPDQLPRACQELMRVAKSSVVVGVPFKQDIRVGRTTCAQCGRINPPWGHVNTFCEGRFKELFSGYAIDAVTYVGENREHTNGVSTFLMDRAGNPYGTYSQEEPCIFCGGKLGDPPSMGLQEKLLAKLGVWIQRFCSLWQRSRPNWIHLRLTKRGGKGCADRLTT